jgi:hypothetical protein
MGKQTNDCNKDTELQEMLVPYLFPLTVEYSVVAMTVGLTMWEKCGWQEPDYVIAPPANSEFVSSSSSEVSFLTKDDNDCLPCTACIVLNQESNCLSLDNMSYLDQRFNSWKLAFILVAQNKQASCS